MVFADRLKTYLCETRAARREPPNLLGRRVAEVRRRTKTVPHAFDKRPVSMFMYAALSPASESWRGVKVAEFETRQLHVLREDLQRVHTERITPVVRISTETRPQRVH